MTRKQVDVAVLGGGAAGLAAAREARRREATVALVSDGPLGGDCTFTGCVPSKTLIESARRGLGFGDAMARVRAVVDHVAGSENAEVLRAEGVDVLEGRGELLGPGRLRVGGTTLTARGVVVATGSRPFVPPIPGLDRLPHLTSDSVWDLSAAPRSLLIVGGGAIGCELGQALALLGTDVTIVEMADRLLTPEEPAASAAVERALAATGVKVRTGTGVASVAPAEAGAGGVVATLGDDTSVSAEQLLVVVGRRPNTVGAGFEVAGLELTDRGHVRTADDLSTNLSGIYAAGDVSGLSAFTHAADHMGRLAAGNILRRVGRSRFRADRIPSVVFTDPEVASVGLTESEAAETHPEARVAELPLTSHDRALAAGETDGFIKLIAAPNPLIGHRGGGRLIGATVVAERAGEMVAELALAVQLRTLVGRLALAVHPYPTWSYAIPKAAGQFFTTIEGRTARTVISS